MVISIIALLATIVLASLNDAREKAAWSKFDSELLQIKTAVQLYREDNNGDWPTGSDSAISGLIEALNTSNLYGGSSLDIPTGSSISAHDNSGDYKFSCGDWTSGIGYVIYVQSSEPLNFSNLLKPLYVSDQGNPNPSAPVDGYSCVDFR